jgi:hypothetical protein
VDDTVDPIDVQEDLILVTADWVASLYPVEVWRCSTTVLLGILVTMVVTYEDGTVRCQSQIPIGFSKYLPKVSMVW